MKMMKMDLIRVGKGGDGLIRSGEGSCNNGSRLEDEEYELSWLDGRPSCMVGNIIKDGITWISSGNEEEVTHK